MYSQRLQTLSTFFPEVGIAGMTAIDGTVAFFTQINALLNPSMTVLDFGAGRGMWYEDDPCDYRRNLQTLKGKVERVVGCDVDPVVLENRSLDEALVIHPGQPLPFADQSFDLILSDFTFEHIQDPTALAAEFLRLLKPGGWICARTPNKYAYSSVATRMVPNRLHVGVLKGAQPRRKSKDVFPTVFRLNTMRDIERAFPRAQFENYTFRALPEPGYHFDRRPILGSMLMLDKLLPRALTAGLYVFLRRRVDAAPDKRFGRS